MPATRRSSVGDQPRVPLPLEGIRVLEITDIWVGPGVGTMLADMGAEVIKVEDVRHLPHSRGQTIKPTPMPTYADFTPGERPWNRNCYYNFHNRNKHGITIDLARPRGVKLYKELVQTADIVVENYAWGIMQKLGVHYEALRESRPDLIMLSMPPYGSTGPYRDHTTFGFCIDCMCGHASLRGYPGDDLTEVPPAFPQDPGGISVGVFATLAALEFRRRTGKGQLIEMAQAESFIPRLGEYVLDYSMNKRVAKAIGNRHPLMAPHGVYRCKGEDKWVTIAIATDDEWRALCRVMGQPELAADPRFTNPLSRWSHQDDLDKLLGRWTSAHQDYELMHSLQAVGVAAGVVMDVPELYEDPHLNHRGGYEVVTHPDAGTHRYPGMPWKLSKSDCHIRMYSNLFGEHNDLVLGGLLGLPSAELKQLEAEQYIGTEPHPVEE